MATPEEAPDLGNSSPVPRAFMSIELATELSSRRARTHADRRVRTVESDWNDATKAGWLRSRLREMERP